MTAIRSLARALLLAAVWAGPARPQEFVQSIGGGDEHRTGGDEELPWFARDKFDRVRFMTYSSTHFLARGMFKGKETVIVFLPPATPPLDTEIPVVAPLQSGPPAPAELGAFVGEPFYPQLAYRMATDDLPKTFRERILAYHDKRFRAQSELRTRIHLLGDLSAEKRERALAEFSVLQKEGIDGLEGEGERLAQDLFPKPLSLLPAEASEPLAMMAIAIRSPEEVPNSSDELHREAEKVRATAYFVEGLPIEDRRLLLEAANDLENSADPGREASQTPAGMRLLSFSPEPARILVPQQLSPRTEAAIEAYLAEKKTVKNKLRQALSRLPQETDKRGLLRNLSAALSSAVTECNSRAEFIRHLLLEVTDRPGPPAPPQLPPDIVARISAYRRHKIEALRVLRTMLAAPPTGESSAGAAKSAAGEGWIRDGSQTRVDPNQLRVRSADFESVQADLVGKLTQEDEAIRESLAKYMRERRGASGPKDINDLLRDFESARQRQELWDQYRDYDAAALLPGLSDGQRRLLFDGAFESLGVALPAGIEIK
jgi:hypothetical protein